MLNIYRPKGKNVSGFTLIEILVVIGMIAILATIVIIAINPARQFAQGRNSQRTANLNAILNAIGQRMADNKGLFREPTDTVCTAAMDITQVDPVPSPLIAATGKKIANTGGVDLRPCLVPTYISELPVDPSVGVVYNGGNYDTGYNVFKDINGRVTVFAPSLESSLNNSVISVTR